MTQRMFLLVAALWFAASPGRAQEQIPAEEPAAEAPAADPGAAAAQEDEAQPAADDAAQAQAEPEAAELAKPAADAKGEDMVARVKRYMLSRPKDQPTRLERLIVAAGAGTLAMVGLAVGVGFGTWALVDYLCLTNIKQCNENRPDGRKIEGTNFLNARLEGERKALVADMGYLVAATFTVVFVLGLAAAFWPAGWWPFGTEEVLEAAAPPAEAEAPAEATPAEAPAEQPATQVTQYPGTAEDAQPAPAAKDETQPDAGTQGGPQ